MKLELQDAQGSTGVFIELPLEQLKEELGLLSSSPEAEAQLKESQEKVVQLEEQLTQGRTMDDFTPTEKANFVLGWAKDLSPEKKAVFAEAVGIPVAGAKVEEVAEVEEKENPKILQGKTDKPGYIYYEYLNLSMREK